MTALPLKFAVPHRGIRRVGLSACCLSGPGRVPLPYLPRRLRQTIDPVPSLQCHIFFFHFRLLGGSWGDLGAIFGALEPIFGALASILAALASILGAFRSIWGDSGPISAIFGYFLMDFGVRK